MSNKLMFSTSTAIELLTGYFNALSKDKKTLFLKKTFENNRDTELLIEYIKSPETYVDNSTELKIGDTIYVEKNVNWSATLEWAKNNNLIFDDYFCAATIIDFDFVPDTKIKVIMHGSQNDKVIDVYTHQHIKLDLV